MNHETDAEESRDLAFRYLETLLPNTPTEAIAGALLKNEKPGLLATIATTAQALGAHLYRVDTQLNELISNTSTLPALEIGDTPRIILSSNAGLVRVLDGTRHESVPAADWGDKRRTFLIPSPRMTLSALRGRSRVWRVIAYLASEKKILKAIVIYAIVVEALSLAAPLAVQVLINTIGFGMMTQQLIVISLLLFIALAGASILSLVQLFLVEHLSRRFFARVLMDFSERLPLIKQAPMKHAVHRFFEVASADKIFFVLGLDLIALVLQLMAATVLLAFYHPIFLGFTALMVFSAWLIVWLPFSRGLTHSIKESHAKYEIAGYLEASGSDEVQRLGHWGSWLGARKKGFRVSMGQQAGLYAVQVFLSVALLFIGGRLVIEGQLTLGQLVAAELVAGTALVSLSKLGKQLPKIYDLITSFEKLGAVVDLDFDSIPTGFSRPPHLAQPASTSNTNGDEL